MTDQVLLEVQGLSKHFGGHVAVDRLSFNLREGELLSLLGPSGCGKTTTLRMIAGFIVPDAGRIVHRGSDITREPPYTRDVGLVFQSYALFPHMSVADNVAFGLRMRRAGRTVIRDRVRWALDLVRLADYGDRRPHELSGGQQQRVAVARVLAAGASLLLLDEPFSNLDAKLRKVMQVELRELQQRLAIATVHVTHDQEEAMTMSDRLLVMNHGRVAQEGVPEEIYQRPTSAFVADFMGRCNWLSGHLGGPGPEPGTVYLDLDAGGRLLARFGPGEPGRGRAVAFVRPEEIGVMPAGAPARSDNVLRGTLRRRVYLGSLTVLYVALDDRTEVLVELQNSSDMKRSHEPDAELDLHIPVSAVKLLAGEGDAGHALARE